jgi:beta-lactamase superfamily II metal-dependent hydrolase
MPIFKLAMHPASEGDALMLTWGDPSSPRHALIDLGRSKDYKALKPLLEGIAAFELVTFTHIDADHISGAVTLFKEASLPFNTRCVWFNAHAQLEAANARLPPNQRVQLGAAQAEKVTKGIITSGWHWNMPFASSIVSIESPEAREPLPFEGLAITLLSPSDRNLADLLPVWNAELKAAGLRTADPDDVDQALAPGRVHLGRPNVDALANVPFKEDGTRPNGSSIAFIAEYAGKRILLGADAYPSVLESSLRARGVSETARIRLDCFKLPHHGSKANLSPSLLRIIDCTCFAISTDGTRHQHPDPEAIARILKTDPLRKKTLVFNYRQHQTEQWEDADLMQQWNYQCVFPADADSAVEINV